MAERDQGLAVAERFGENLRRVRKREDLSQERLAGRASLHRTEIGRLEKGERVCRIDTLIRLAGAMAVPPAELLDGIDWVPGSDPDGAFSVNSSRIPARPRPAIEEASESSTEATQRARQATQSKATEASQ
jgi:transcriptional regulator with XRE-family HTH domain